MKEFLHIEVSKEMKEGINKQAEREYTTSSSLVRRVIREYLESDSKAVFSGKRHLTSYDRAVQKTIGEYAPINNNIDHKKYEEELQKVDPETTKILLEEKKKQLEVFRSLGIPDGLND